MNNPFCCGEMEENAGEELQIVHYSPVFDEYGVTIPEDGSVMLLRYCPWCGRKLPERKRDAWFDQLVALGYEDPLFRDDIPEAYQSDAWRK